MIDRAALLDLLFLVAAAVGHVRVFGAVADHGAGDGASCGGCRAAAAAAHLVTGQATDQAANDGAAHAALWWRLLDLHVFGTAFLARTVDLLDLRRHAHYAAVIFEIGGAGNLCKWQGADAEGCRDQFGVQAHV